MQDVVVWIAMAVCISQSAMFSGLNLAFFSLSRLRLEVEAASGSGDARRVLELRAEPNLVLTTVLIGNVAVNVILTLLSDSVMSGVAAFFFSTVVITAFGEIVPQAYFSRNALRVASVLAPIFIAYRTVLYPIARPAARLLDRWLGEEGLIYFREREMRHLIRKHIDASEAEIDRIEGLGALNFLAIDDLPILHEGEPIAPSSIIRIRFDGDVPVFPEFRQRRDDVFLLQVHASGEKWVVLLDHWGMPRLVMDADGFLRDAMLAEAPVDPADYCHRPIVVRDASRNLGTVLSQWNVQPKYPGDNVVDRDLIIVWNDTKRIITGADILGRLLSGITHVAAPEPAHVQ
jgi:metal transporter CNNM